MEAINNEASAGTVMSSEVVEGLEPILVTGILQVVIPTPNEAMHMMHKSLMSVEQTLNAHTHHLESISNRIRQDIESIDSINILYEIKKMIEKRIDNRVLVSPRYLKTKDAASYIGVDPSFLTKKQEIIFKEGIHFFRPGGSAILRWDIDALEVWMRTAKEEENHDEILDKMFQ